MLILAVALNEMKPQVSRIQIIQNDPFQIQMFNNSIVVLGRSPIFSHMNSTLQGLSTLRAFGADSIAEKEFHEFQNHNIACWYLSSCASRWVAIWLDMLCVLFITFVTYSFLLFEDGKLIEFSIWI